MAAHYDEGTLREFIDRCLHEGKGLSDWEKNFLESVSDRLDFAGTLSEKQEEILERIYVNKVP